MDTCDLTGVSDQHINGDWLARTPSKSCRRQLTVFLGCGGLNISQFYLMIVNPFPRSRCQEIHSASLWLLELYKLRLAQASDTSLNLGYDSNNPHD